MLMSLSVYNVYLSICPYVLFLLMCSHICDLCLYMCLSCMITCVTVHIFRCVHASVCVLIDVHVWLCEYVA